MTSPNLHDAIEAEDIDTVRQLCADGAAIHISHARAALQGPKWAEMLQVLIDGGFDVNSQTTRQQPFLSFALLDDNEAKLRFLLERGADPNGQSVRWRSRHLDACASNGSIDRFKLLLSYGARLDLANPLHSAAIVRDQDPVPADASSAAVNNAKSEEDDEKSQARDRKRRQARNRIPMMTYLLDECQLDINAISHFGDRPTKRAGDEDGTPLQAAVRGSSESHIRFLLDRGADPNVESAGGDNALEYARRNQLFEGLEILQTALAAR